MYTRITFQLREAIGTMPSAPYLSVYCAGLQVPSKFESNEPLSILWSLSILFPSGPDAVRSTFLQSGEASS